MRYMLTVLMGFCFQQVLLAQSYTLTYSAGDIGGPNNFTTVSPTSCPGTLTFSNIPLGATIDSVQVSYTFFTSLVGFGSVTTQRSFIRCSSNSTSEAQLALPVVPGGLVTQINYQRTIQIANGIVSGPVVFELHAGSADPLSFSSCTGTSNLVLNNSWTMTVFTSEGSCLQPQQIQLSQQGGDSVHFNWTQPGSALSWELAYGLAGTPQNQLSVLPATQNQLGVGQLNQATAYDAYIRAVCMVGDTSNWSPLFSFTTDTFSCAAPDTGWGTSAAPGSAVLRWNGQPHAVSYDLTYGSRGFTPGAGVLLNAINADSVVLSTLTGTDFDFYVRQYCGMSYSGWSGPFAFSLSTVGLEEQKPAFGKVYPQPATAVVFVEVLQNSHWRLLNMLGQQQAFGYWEAGTQELSLEQFPAGVYMLQTGKQLQKLIKR